MGTCSSHENGGVEVATLREENHCRAGKSDCADGESLGDGQRSDRQLSQTWRGLWNLPESNVITLLTKRGALAPVSHKREDKQDVVPESEQN